MIQSKKTYALLLVLPTLMSGAESSQKQIFPGEQREKTDQSTEDPFASIAASMRKPLTHQQVEDPKTGADVVQSRALLALRACDCKRCAKL